MNKIVAIFIAGLPLAWSAPAFAAYVDATYSGAVTQVNAGRVPQGIAVGTPITVNVVFDTSKLVDHTASFNADNGTSFSSVKTASLADDAADSLSIKIGSVSFKKYDQLYYGTPGSDCGPTCDYGVGNFPIVEYLNNTFSGVGNILINSKAFSLDPDPIADYFSGGFGLMGPGTGTNNFYLGIGNADNPFVVGFAVGNFDIADVKVTQLPAAVPLPAGLPLLGTAIVGLAGLRIRQRW